MSARTVIGRTDCRDLDDSRPAQEVRGGWNYPGDAFIHGQDGYFF